MAYVAFIVHGTHFISAVPEDFDYNPHSGKHGDRSHRVELRRSCVEFIAPSEYMVSIFF